MPGADGMSSKFMKNAFVGWTFTAGLYYPPDFDASKLAPIKTLRVKGQSKEQVMNIRMMFPFTMICDTCSEYNYTGTKFTARVETIKQESYLGIKVYRFYGRCRHCWAEFTFKTDPKNSDYTMESGGKRTYEAWKDADMMESMIKAEKEKEAELDQMKALEQKSIDVQSEMQRLEDLDAIRTMNKRLGAREKTIEEALAMLFERDQKRAETQDDMFEEGDREQLAAFKDRGPGGAEAAEAGRGAGERSPPRSRHGRVRQRQGLRQLLGRRGRRPRGRRLRGRRLREQRFRGQRQRQRQRRLRRGRRRRRRLQRRRRRDRLRGRREGGGQREQGVRGGREVRHQAEGGRRRGRRRQEAPRGHGGRRRGARRGRAGARQLRQRLELTRTAPRPGSSAASSSRVARTSGRSCAK
ncbi:unnamed protein product [Prorocentrum cordatum]|uniref:Splicing factor YJU2 n=1 Tax=Prorocentrum cordatum TaxID=2364126 RepID=A0ABN9Y9I1_9DINO|nr:unnamed protein product [Polarella glacialis]